MKGHGHLGTVIMSIHVNTYLVDLKKHKGTECMMLDISVFWNSVITGPTHSILMAFCHLLCGSPWSFASLLWWLLVTYWDLLGMPNLSLPVLLVNP